MATEFDPDLTEAEKREEKEAEAASDQEGAVRYVTNTLPALVTVSNGLM